MDSKDFLKNFELRKYQVFFILLNNIHVKKPILTLKVLNLIMVKS